MIRALGPGATIGFALTCAVLLANAAVSYDNVRRLADNERRVDHTRDVLDTLAAALSNLKDAENGQRGYVLTGDPSYRALYRDAAAASPAKLDRLRDLTADNPDQQARADRLGDLAAAVVTSLGEGIR